MSALADVGASSIAPRPLFARWTGAWSRLNRRHALGATLAILMMTAIDLSTMADKLAQPGVVKVVVFDLFVSVSLFTITVVVRTILFFFFVATTLRYLNAFTGRSSDSAAAGSASGDSSP